MRKVEFQLKKLVVLHHKVYFVDNYFIFAE